MANEKAPPVDSQFRAWYSTLGFGEDEARITARWLGTVSVLKQLTPEDLEAHIRVALRTKQPAAAPAIERVRGAFKDAVLFDGANATREAEVISGSILGLTLT